MSFGKQEDRPAVVAPADGEGVEEEEDDEEPDYDHGAHDEATPLRHTLLTAGIIIPGFAIAYFVNSLQLGMSCI